MGNYPILISDNTIIDYLFDQKIQLSTNEKRGFRKHNANYFYC